MNYYCFIKCTLFSDLYQVCSPVLFSRRKIICKRNQIEKPPITLGDFFRDKSMDMLSVQVRPIAASNASFSIGFVFAIDGATVDENRTAANTVYTTVLCVCIYHRCSHKICLSSERARKNVKARAAINNRPKRSNFASRLGRLRLYPDTIAIPAGRKRETDMDARASPRNVTPLHAGDVRRSRDDDDARPASHKYDYSRQHISTTGVCAIYLTFIKY